MLDLRFVRDNLDTVKQAAINKNEQVDINQFINLDSRRREILQTSVVAKTLILKLRQCEKFQLRLRKSMLI